MSPAPFSLLGSNQRPGCAPAERQALLAEREARLRSEAERDAAVAEAANAQAGRAVTERNG